VQDRDLDYRCNAETLREMGQAARTENTRK